MFGKGFVCYFRLFFIVLASVVLVPAVSWAQNGALAGVVRDHLSGARRLQTVHE